MKGIEMSRSLKIFVVFMNLIFGGFWIAGYAREGPLTFENILTVFMGMLFVNVVAVPLMIHSDNSRRAFYGPSKPKPPKKLPPTQGKTILEAEHHNLIEVRLEEIPNLHELTRINLGLNQLKTIDLSPLAGSTNLKELVLYMNHLESIDLSPLASCPNFEYLDLTDNKIESIDLTPFSSCLKLTGLNIGMNRTSQLDLSPISECRELEVLNVDSMNLREIDLSPLRGFTKLWFLKLDDNEFTSLDITPLFECESLTEFPIDNVELTTTISREIEDWPKGVRKHRKKFRKS